MIIESPLESLKCIVCKQKINLGQAREPQIYATRFPTHGNYGSSIIDNMRSDDEMLEIIICDKCLAQNADCLYKYNSEHDNYFTFDSKYTNHVKELLPIYDEIKEGFLAKEKSNYFILDRVTGNILRLSEAELELLENKSFGDVSSKIENSRNKKLSQRRYRLLSKGDVLNYFENYDERENKGFGITEN